MLKVCLVGFGRTGKVVAEEIFKREDVNLVGIFKKRRDKFIGVDIGKYFGKGEKGYGIHHISDLENILKKTNPDMLIDFSHPEAMFYCVDTIASCNLFHELY